MRTSGTSEKYVIVSYFRSFLLSVRYPYLSVYLYRYCLCIRMHICISQQALWCPTSSTVIDWLRAKSNALLYFESGVGLAGRVQPALHACGHLHSARGVDRSPQGTPVVNAAMVGDHSKGIVATPWLFECKRSKRQRLGVPFAHNKGMAAQQKRILAESTKYKCEQVASFVDV